ncbi:MAG: DNA polymerase III subunit theta [Symbiopectobacterium sp.]
MAHNLANLTAQEMDKVNVDLAASSVAFKERYNMPVIPELVEKEQPKHLRDYFRKRIAFYRQRSLQFSCLPYDYKAK